MSRRVALSGFVVLLASMVCGQLNKSPQQTSFPNQQIQHQIQPFHLQQQQQPQQQQQQQLAFHQVQQKHIDFAVSPRIVQNNQRQQQNQQEVRQFNVREPARSKQTMTLVQPLIKEQGIRVTLSETSPGYGKLESVIGILDRVAYAVSKPATIVNIVRFITLALSTLIMSNFIFPTMTIFDMSKKKNRDRFNRYNPLNHITRPDIENMIELMARNYDDTLNRAGLMEKDSCRERSLCVIGDMVSCEFPNVVLSVGNFAQNHLPPIDHSKNKYAKALVLGLNQTNCDQAYKLNDYECPSFRDYVRSYFQGGARRRRDHRIWKKHH